jgi:hypothetical protein
MFGDTLDAGSRHTSFFADHFTPNGIALPYDKFAQLMVEFR